MLRALRYPLAVTALALLGCHSSSYAVRPIPRIAAESVGKPVYRLKEAFGPPRKVDTTATKMVYVWFLEQKPDGAPVGFHGCEMEVTVDTKSEHVLGYSLSNIGWAKCPQVSRKIRVAERLQ
jgi:hypothetical protein